MAQEGPKDQGANLDELGTLDLEGTRELQELTEVLERRGLWVCLAFRVRWGCQGLLAPQDLREPLASQGSKANRATWVYQGSKESQV